MRPPRRPPGWRAAGPPPREAGSGPQAGEDLCYLAGDWRIFQRLGGHRWSLDDLVTAWVAAETLASLPPARYLDLGCGIGTVLLLLAWRFPHAQGLGLEAQELSVELARRSIAWNGVEARCAVRHGDLRQATLVPEGSAFDLVTGTPPYLRPGTAMESQRLQVGASHIELRGGLEDYCAAAARLLTPGGTFVTCAGSVQVRRVAPAAAAAGLHIVRSQAVVPRAGKAPLFGVYVMQRDRPPIARADPPLIVRDQRGQRTAEFRALRGAMGMPP